MKRFAMLSCILVLTACEQKPAEVTSTGNDGSIQSTPLNPLSENPGQTLFQMLDPKNTGVNFANMVDEKIERRDLYITTFAGGGVAVGDYDNDGKPDLYFTSQLKDNRLYRQVGHMKFEDVTEKAGVGGNAKWACGTTFVDIDNDNDLDLYVCNYDAPNQLFINQGDGTFKERAKEFGLDFNGATTMVSFADYDLDGDLDVYLLTYRLYPKPGTSPENRIILTNKGPVVHESQKEHIQIQNRPTGPAVIDAGQRDYLFRNNGDNTFTDVSKDAGISRDDVYHGLSATWWDYNNDGYPDLYVANDFFDPDRLYRNNRDGSFTNVIDKNMAHTPWYSMGADAADINNDGKLDLFVADMSATSHLMSKIMMGDMDNSGWFLDTEEPRQYMHNVMYLNTGTSRFIDVSFMAGLDSTDWTWATKFADFDLDGNIDLFVTNGTVRLLMDSDLNIEIGKTVSSFLKGRKINELTQKERQEYQVISFEMANNRPRNKQRNLAFRNLGNLKFDKAAKSWGLDHEGISYGAATADLDRDGDLDLIVSNIDEPVQIYQNHAQNAHRIAIRLMGNASPKHGIGAKVTIVTNTGIQVREMFTERGYVSSNEPLIHFGLGKNTTINTLKVNWPSGHEQTFKNIKANHFYTITEPTGKPNLHKSVPAKEADTPLFNLVSDMSGIRHNERAFDDFKKQPLLPNRLSRFGPGIAVADTNADGKDDFYLGGASGHNGKLYVNKGDRFDWKMREAWDRHSFREDMAPLFIDVDSDGDLDLYVASGSAECEPGESMLKDRLYLNDGKGNYSDASDQWLPDLRDATSHVVALDFDHDGDLDLFVASRLIPGQYPLSPQSRLLRNEGDKFVDITDSNAPQFKSVGLISSALASDIDNDNDLDLILAVDWGPVKVFVNNDGKFQDATQTSGTAHLLGWWNAIAAADIDNDGDMDYITTNFGLNTKYRQLSDKKPQYVFYGDFEGNGNHHIVEAKKGSDGKMLPVRGRSCSSNAMPFIKEKFGTYRSFGMASLEDIYSPQNLEKSSTFKANELQSGVWFNDSSNGQIKLRFVPLPRIAQTSPGFGVIAEDFDGDRNIDIFIAQNFYWPQRETSRYDTGIGIFLKGNGKGQFTPLTSQQSGLLIDKDARGAALGDWNGDNKPDIVVANNDDNILGYTNNAQGNYLRLDLKSSTASKHPIGTKILVYWNDGHSRLIEINAGSGYLSQSTPSIFLAHPEKLKSAQVIWPNGKKDDYDLKNKSGRIVIQQN